MNFNDQHYDPEKQPEAYRKQQDWAVGFGLQAADNLKPSQYIQELAQANVEGTKTYADIEQEVHRYYSKNKAVARTMEADLSSIRIAEILSSDAFTFNPGTLKGYHRRLFSDIPEFTFTPGDYRQENITKSEVVLAGNTVNYADYRDIVETLNWDFAQEKKQSYQDMDKMVIVQSVTKFISGIWQIHPFREGNTRTTAVFLIKYVRSLGFELDNEPFKQQAQYFRDALVLANTNLQYQNTTFLDQFMKNAILGERVSLDIRDMLLDQIIKRTPELNGKQLKTWLHQKVADDPEKLAKILLLKNDDRLQYIDKFLKPNAFEQRVIDAQITQKQQVNHPDPEQHQGKRL
jgi:fido (protein-threonine AMPylation protein)